MVIAQAEHCQTYAAQIIPVPRRFQHLRRTVAFREQSGHGLFRCCLANTATHASNRNIELRPVQLCKLNNRSINILNNQHTLTGSKLYRQRPFTYDGECCAFGKRFRNELMAVASARERNKDITWLQNTCIVADALPTRRGRSYHRKT